MGNRGLLRKAKSVFFGNKWDMKAHQQAWLILVHRATLWLLRASTLNWDFSTSKDTYFLRFQLTISYILSYNSGKIWGIHTTCIYRQFHVWNGMVNTAITSGSRRMTQSYNFWLSVRSFWVQTSLLGFSLASPNQMFKLNHIMKVNNLWSDNYSSKTTTILF